MKKLLIVLFFLLLILVGWAIYSYNAIVNADEAVVVEWIKVEEQYNRRLELLPPLMALAEDAPQGKLTDSLRILRKELGTIAVDHRSIGSESFKQYQHIQEELSEVVLLFIQSIGQNGKNDKNMALSAQLEGCENRIAVAKMRFNEKIQEYNLTVKKFPNNIVASSLGYSKAIYLKPQPNSTIAGNEVKGEPFRIANYLWIVVLIALVAIFYWAKNGYNKMVSLDENVASSWSDVESHYQQRLDLVPSLVGALKGYVVHEKGLLEAVVLARSKATSINISPQHLDESSLQKFEAAQGGFSAALGRLLVAAEEYPEIKADRGFQSLMNTLSSIEEKILKSRAIFNNVANVYNKIIRHFPDNILAKLFHFNPKAYFKAEAGAEKAPKVEF